MPECRSNAVPPFKASTTREPSSYHSGWNMPTSMIGTTDTPRRLDTSPTSRFHTAWTLSSRSTHSDLSVLHQETVYDARRPDVTRAADANSNPRLNRNHALNRCVMAGELIVE
jgi:hypothetical protein